MPLKDVGLVVSRDRVAAKRIFDVGLVGSGRYAGGFIF